MCIPLYNLTHMTRLEITDFWEPVTRFSLFGSRVDVSSISWEISKGDEADIPVDVQVDSSQLPLVSNKDGEQFLRMYWIDAYEDPYKQPGK